MKLIELVRLVGSLGIGGFLGALTDWISAVARVETAARSLDQAVREILPVIPADRTASLLNTIRELSNEVSVLREATGRLGRSVSRR